MRLGDLDALKNEVQNICKTYTEMSANQLGYDILNLIDNAPAVSTEDCEGCPYCPNSNSGIPIGVE